MDWRLTAVWKVLIPRHDLVLGLPRSRCLQYGYSCRSTGLALHLGWHRGTLFGTCGDGQTAIFNEDHPRRFFSVRVGAHSQRLTLAARHSQVYPPLSPQLTRQSVSTKCFEQGSLEPPRTFRPGNNNSGTSDPRFVRAVSELWCNGLFPRSPLRFLVPCLLVIECHIRLFGMYKITAGGLAPPISPRFSLPMSASDVLRKFVKRDVASHESRRALDEFLRSPCYNYFLKNLRGPDILGYADFLDKASTGAIRCICGQGSHRFSRH